MTLEFIPRQHAVRLVNVSHEGLSQPEHSNRLHGQFDVQVGEGKGLHMGPELVVVPFDIATVRLPGAHQHQDGGGVRRQSLSGHAVARN